MLIRRTPSDDDPDGGIGAAHDAESREVADVVVGRHSEQESVDEED